MDGLDGNAIGGLLQEVFGTEMTAAIGTCAACGYRGPLPSLRERADGVRQGPQPRLRRPERAGRARGPLTRTGRHNT